MFVTLSFTYPFLNFNDVQLNQKREQQYQEYLKAKVKRQKEASEAAKNLHMKSYKEVSNKLLPNVPPHDDDDGYAGRSKVKRTRFELPNSNQLRKRRGYSEDFSDDEVDDVQGDDLYLYRQPELNKVLWETKPRPYFQWW